MSAVASRRVGWTIAAIVLGAGPGRAASAYDAIVAPIFAARCVACHGPEKQKGRLALHTWEGATKGGGSGPLWVAGRAAESELVRRLKLPLDDEEHMPPGDEPQPAKEEIELLVAWIERGASGTDPVERLRLPPALAAAATGLKRTLPAATQPAAPAAEADPAEVAAARAPLAPKVAELQRRFPGALGYESRGSARLHFTAAGLGRDFGDAQLALLEPLAPALVQLELSGTSLTDAAAPTLAKFTELRVLRLGFTSVGDATLAALAGLSRLEVLAFPETQVTADGLRALGRLGALRRVHPGGSLLASASAARLPVVDPGLEALQVASPVEAPAAVDAK